MEVRLRLDNSQSTYERLTVDLGRHICDKIGTDEPEPKRVLAVKVEEQGPIYFTLQSSFHAGITRQRTYLSDYLFDK